VVCVVGVFTSLGSGSAGMSVFVESFRSVLPPLVVIIFPINASIVGVVASIVMVRVMVSHWWSSVASST
jgi:hypothetical protein